MHPFVRFFFLLGIWALASPYLDFSVNDGGLYAGEALRRLEGPNFAKDVFFLGSTQGNFSLFGVLYAQVTAVWGIKMAGLILATAGQIGWVVSAYRLVSAGWGDRRFVALALMLLLPAAYDGYGLFSYAGSEVTARCGAEAAVLWALGQQLRGQRLSAWGWMGVAVALHPLMALPGVAWLGWLQPVRWRVMGLVGVTIGILSAAAWGIEPFSRLWQTFDPVWWESVQVLTGYALVSSWPTLAWAKAMVWAALLGYVGWGAHQEERLRPWARALLLCLLGLLAMWWVGCVTRNVLVVQLQVWRVLWLAQLLAPALWVGTLPAWKTWGPRMWAHVLLVGAALLSLSAPLMLSVVLALGLVQPTVAAKLDRLSVTRWFPYVAGGLLGMALAVRWPAWVYTDQVQHLNQLAHASWVSWAKEPMWTLPVVGAYFVFSAMARSRWAKIGWMALGCLPCAMFGGVFSVQLDRARVPLEDASALREIIPEGALVYWDAGSDHTWFRLHRSQYADVSQAPNSLFSREAAMEFRRRLALLEQSGMIGDVPNRPETFSTVKPDIQRWRAQLDLSAKNRSLGAHNIQAICQDPTLDYVLLSMDIPEADARISYSAVPGGRVSVFKCRF